MIIHCNAAPSGQASNSYIHSFREREISATAARLKLGHSPLVDVAELSYDDLARQLLVRDLRIAADDLGIQNYSTDWSCDELSGKLELPLDFGCEADIVHFKLRVG